MPRFNTEEQFKFLISCIRYSNNGRIDFVEVARECSIVSKGAAAKRYERMMKAHSIGVDMNAADGSGSEASTPRKKRKRAQTDTTNEKSEEPDDSVNIKNEGMDLETNVGGSLEEDAYADAHDFGANVKIDDVDGIADDETNGSDLNGQPIKQEH